MFAVEMCGSSLHVQCWEMGNNLQLLVKPLYLLQIMTNQIYFIFASELKDSYGSFIKMTLLLCVETLSPVQRGLNGGLKLLLLLLQWNKFLLPVTKLSLHFHPKQKVWAGCLRLEFMSRNVFWCTKRLLASTDTPCPSLDLTQAVYIYAYSQTHTHILTLPRVCVCVHRFTGCSSENQCCQ